MSEISLQIQKPGRKVFISTYGCQMNDHDTERMYSLLEANHYLQAISPEEADVIIINSCSVREKPVHKVRSEVGKYRSLKNSKPHLKIGVGGCVGQQEGKGLLKQNRGVDFVFGTDTIDKLPEILDSVSEGARDAWTRMGHRDPYSINTLVRSTPATAFVTITKGCDNFCSFCIVPFTRGRERSRLLHEIVDDIKKLHEKGAVEVTLLGQNVNSYNSPDGNGRFTDLLRAVCSETGVERVRFTTSHPKDFGPDLVDLFVKYPKKLGQYLHLPVQCGSDRILERMNRGYTKAVYMEKINLLKAAVPDIALSTDIIVGFPGETDEDFEMTMDLLKEVKFENVYAFKYSPRPFTKALKFEDQVPENIKDLRLSRIMKYQEEQALEIAKKYEGKTFEVLNEGPCRGSPGFYFGRTNHFRVVHFQSKTPEKTGAIVPVQINRALPFVIYGERV